MTSDDRDPVDVLAEEFADRLRRGEHPSVSDYAAAHPAHADQLRDLLPAVAQMEMLKRFRNPVAPPSLPDRLGDFRIVRELGRGGMGIVFEAVQESLGRPVALKVLARHAQLDTTRRERFVREAQAAAKLHHTNIVPVFGVGEHDGLPYYVMQLIPGCGLHAVVWQWRQSAGRNTSAASRTRDLHHPDTEPDDTGDTGPPGGPEVHTPAYGDWRFVAEIGLQTAYALHYAHKQGVLHRDVKPANLILDGEIVWVTDFGLAKLMGSDGLTATGDILGTLQYMPPESLAGRADARSDVYGLGATLYELLTLEPPYASDSPAKLVKLVADVDPPPPRTLNPHIPRDLETIVLKAMAREPSGRYASARELAEDLEAFLEDRPIKARRTSTASHAWRWCRRNPAVASLALSTLLAVSLSAVAGWVGYARSTAALGRESALRQDAEREQQKAERAKHDAEKARADAEQAKAEADRATADAQSKSEQLKKNLKLALDTCEKVFDAAGDTGRQGFGIPIALVMVGPGGPGGPGHGPGHGPGGPDHGPGAGGPAGGPGGGAADSTSAKAAILEAVLDFYDEFARQNPPGRDRDLKFEAAKASRRVCEAHVGLKNPEKAVAAFRRAVGLLEPLVEQFPDRADMRDELAMVYAVAPLEAFPADPELPLRRITELDGNKWLVATAQLRLGLAREQAGDRTGAETAYRAAAAAFAAAEPSNRPTPGHLELAYTRLQLARVLSEQGKLPAARKVLDESVASLLTPAAQGDGRGRPEREWLAFTYSALAWVCKEQKDERGADSANKKADQYSGIGPGGPKKDGPGGMGPGGPWGGWGGWGGGGKKDGPPPRKDGPKP